MRSTRRMGIIATLAVIFVLAWQSIVSAHTPSHTESCEAVSVTGTHYESGDTNTLGIKVDNHPWVTQSFENSGTLSVTPAQDGQAHTYRSYVHTSNQNPSYSQDYGPFTFTCGEAPPPPPKVVKKRTHVNLHKIDRCNCWRDKVWVTHGPNVRVVTHHPSRLVWTIKAVGKRVGDKQYLLPSRISGHHGWARVQHYTVHTTNIPCPCHRTHTCPPAADQPPHHHCKTACRKEG